MYGEKDENVGIVRGRSKALLLQGNRGIFVFLHIQGYYKYHPICCYYG